MMKIRNLVCSIPAFAKNGWQRLRNRGSKQSQIRLSRKHIYVMTTTGALHVIPRPVAGQIWAVASEDASIVFLIAENKVAIKEADQNAAINLVAQVKKALTSNRLVVWGVRLFALWILFLFMSSFSQNLQKQQSTLSSAAPAAYPSQSALQDFPTATESPVQGDPAQAIYKAAMAAQRQSAAQNMPPKADNNTAGLDGFGLDVNGSGGESGKGCDPALAFTVPNSNNQTK